MYTEAELLTLELVTSDKDSSMTDRELNRLRAAEAHHRSVLLQEGRVLHSDPAGAWDRHWHASLSRDG